MFDEKMNQLEKICEEMGLTPQQAAKVLKASQQPEPKRNVRKKLPLSAKHIKIGVTGYQQKRCTTELHMLL